MLMEGLSKAVRAAASDTSAAGAVAAADGSAATPDSDSGASSDSEAGDATLDSPTAGRSAEAPPSPSDAAERLCRPRFSSDGTSRHLQVVTLLLNNPRCDVLHRTRNGVHAGMVLAACPSADAVAILDWMLEKAGCRAAAGGGGELPSRDSSKSGRSVGGRAAASEGATSGSDAPGALQASSSNKRDGTGTVSVPVPFWAPDAAGANIVHYAAYAANADALRLLMRACEEGLLRRLISAPDRFGRAPLDVLALYSEDTILSSARTKALQRAGMWGEVPFESRRREFRTLLTTLL